MGTNHEVKSVTIFLDGDGAVLVRALRRFQKGATKLKKKQTLI